MRYSVYNDALRNYTVYEGPQTEQRPRFSSVGSLGCIPESVSGYLPARSICLGQSEEPQGRIVERDRNVGDFLLEFVTIVASMIAARLIYDSFFKR